MSKITLIDYNIGNLLSVERAVRHVGGDLSIATTPEEVLVADKLIVPGVGAFQSCVDELQKRNLFEAVKEFAATEKPLLGICVGMQMLFDESEEFGSHKGFGFIEGTVKAIPANDIEGNPHKIPHMGWTSLEVPEGQEGWRSPLLEGVLDGAEVYFVHSFTAYPAHNEDRLADAHYGGQRLSAMVNKGNIYGTQFHPEKSGHVGLQILGNFINM